MNKIPEELSPTIATSYLEEAGNEQNKAWLSREYFQLKYKGKLKVYPLKSIQRLSFNHRKLLLPLVIGSIAASLSMVAIIKLFYNPYLTLSLLAAGCLAAYRGYQGSWVFTVEEAKYHSDFFIKSVSPNFKAFVRYANTFTGNQPQGILYLPIHTTQWEKGQQSGSIRIFEPARLYFGFELTDISQANTLIIPISSLDDQIHINWQPVSAKEEEGDIFPFIQPNSVVPIENVRPINS